MSYKLFLDDYRLPIDCISYMYRRIGNKNVMYLRTDWNIVKNYKEFTDCILKNGIPELISFDHDLAEEHYCPPEWYASYDDWHSHAQFIEKTGADCAKWLVEHCNKNKLPLPNCVIHSMNPVGSENIENILKHRHENLKENYLIITKFSK